MPFYEPAPYDAKGYPDGKGPPVFHLEHGSWKDGRIWWWPIKQRMRTMLKRVLDKWLNLEMLGSYESNPTRNYAKTNPAQAIIIRPYPRNRNPEADDIRRIFDRPSLKEGEGFATANDRHYIIARMIRSLRMVGLKVQAKALYNYFIYFGDKTDNRSRRLWKIAMFGSKWKSFYPSNKKLWDNSGDLESDYDSDSSDEDDKRPNRWRASDDESEEEEEEKEEEEEEEEGGGRRR